MKKPRYKMVAYRVDPKGYAIIADVARSIGMTVPELSFSATLQLLAKWAEQDARKSKAK